MDLATSLTLVQTILIVLQQTQLLKAWSMWGKQADLDGLGGEVRTINKVLLDAEGKQDEELSQEIRLYIEELRDAIYDADDLLDAFVTLANQNQFDGKIKQKVSHFISRVNPNPFSRAAKLSSRVSDIMGKLGRIASKHSKYGLNLSQERISRRVETCSKTNIEIIGRDEDVDNIVKILLDTNVQRDVSFLTIVGMGGLGKTALAQLVYKHENITKEFPLRLWICVSDHDQSKLDVKTILTVILESATKTKHDGFSMDVVVGQLQKELERERFLIVLDDLWSESCDDLRQLVGYLVGGRGSQILVTSRSTETANIIGDGLMYELKGLSDKNSWRLFQLMAFGELVEQASPNRYDDFIDIGNAIVKTCSNVPLAIRVLGSLLYRQDINKWRSVQALGLANVREGRDTIKPILKLSYDNLQSSLKSCFSFCSLYPKDFEIRKDLLISLWIAQGYIMPFEKGQSLEEAAEEYFRILLHRCFFHHYALFVQCVLFAVSGLQ